MTEDEEDVVTGETEGERDVVTGEVKPDPRLWSQG